MLHPHGKGLQGLVTLLSEICDLAVTTRLVMVQSNVENHLWNDALGLGRSNPNGNLRIYTVNIMKKGEKISKNVWTLYLKAPSISIAFV